MSFTLDLKEFEEAAIGDTIQFIRKSVLEIYKGVVLKSPVDTGRFRANWNVSIGANDYSVNAAISAKGGLSSEEFSKANTALLALTGDGSAFISNGLPYAARLETGYSKQAPIGMVDVTLVEYKTALSKQIAKQI